MQLYLCQTSLPWVTSGVMSCALVSSPKRMWLWMVRPMKATAATPVATMANMRDCRLFMRLPLDGDRGPVGDSRVPGIGGGRHHQQQHQHCKPAHGRNQTGSVHQQCSLMGVFLHVPVRNGV